MGLFDGSLRRWLGKPASARASKGAAARAAGPNSTQFAASQDASASSSQMSAHSVRKDVLKVVMRETLQRNGIPDSWVSADLLRTNSNARKEPGIHVRFLVKHWDERLMQYGVAFEQEFYQRLMAMDPLAANWLMGFSWQFAMEDFTRCPGLPHPGSWTAPPQEDTAPGEDKPITRAGDIIEGPVLIPQPREDVRADLDRLLALRDEDMKRHGDGFAATRPVQL